ncbi:unnamed protein product [Closterium sp. NIES-64]|nr:unnamed protein product [Closterium sp. NIES-64]
MGGVGEGAAEVAEERAAEAAREGAAAGEAAADAAGEAARAAACKVGQTLAGEAAQSTAGEVAGTAIGEAAGTAAGEAAGTTADEAAGGTRAGEAAGSAAGEAEIAAAVEVEQILAGEAAQTAAGEAAGTAAGEAAGTAAREAAGTAAGKAAGTAAGEAEQITAGEVLQTAAVEAARTAAGATEATVGAGTGGGATGAAGKGVTGTGARESAASVVAREGTAGARVGEGTAVASKAEGEAAAEAAGRAIARPIGAAGAAANAGKHTTGPAETAKGASSKAAAGGVGSGDIGATGEGEVSVVPTGVGTEEGDVIAIEKDEGEDVMHIDGPLAQYLTPDGEADPAPLQPHVEVPPLPPMPVHMLAEGPMEGLGETLRTEPHEGAPILTSRPPAHPPPGAPFPHPHPQVPVVSRGAAKALAFLAEPCSPTPTLLHGQPPSPSPTPDPTVAGGPPGEHAGATRAESPEGTPSLTSHPSPPLPSLLPSPPRAAHLCPHPQGLLRAPRGAARALAFLEEPCSPTPTNTQPPPTGPLPPPPPGPPPPGSTHISEVEASLRPNPSPTRYRHPNHPSRRTAPTRPPNRLPPSHHPPQAAETHPQGLAPQAHGSGGTRVEGPTGEATTEPTQTPLPPPFVPRSNLHTGPAPRPPPSTPPPGRVPHEWPRWAAITPHTQPARSVPTEGDVSRREGMHTEHPPPGEPPILPPTTPLAPQPPLPSQTGADNRVGRRRKNRGRGGRGSAHVLPPPSLPHQEPLPTPHPVEPLPGPTATARPPNPHSRPAPTPPQGHGSGPAHSPPFCPSLAVSPSQVAAAAIATGMEAVGLRDAPMEDATDSPSHPSHPFHVDDPLPQPMVIGEGQGGLLGQGPHPSSAQPASPTPPSTLPALLLSPTGRQVFETPEEVRAGISDLLAIHRPSSSPAAPTLPVPQDRTRTYAEVTRSVPSFIPPATQPGASLPTPMETDRVLRPCHAHLEGVAPPPVQPVAQEVTSSRDEASAPTETPPPGVAEPSLEPHPAEGQEHTTVHTSGSPPRPPSPASTPVPARGPALSCATPPLSSLTPPPHGAGESSPPLIPGDPLGAQAAHGVPSTASSDAMAPIDPADTATSPDQVVSCPTCRSSFANRRALQHHIPFCHPADAARRAQAAHDTASIIPSLSQPRATGIQFTDAQWQTLDSVDWTEYFSPERIHARPLRRVPERVRGGYLNVLSAILVRIAQDPEAAGPTFLLAAAPTLFLVPATPPDRSHTAAIATRISRFGRGEWAELVSDALGRRTPLPRRTGHRSRTATDPSTADERRIARCLRLAACNETSRACAALESAEAAPDTQGTIQRLQSKHPNAERPTPAWQSGFQRSPLVLSVDHLRRAIFTAPRGSSGVPSGWVAEHLRDTFLAFPQSLHFLLAVYQQWLRGRCAPAARSLLASSTLVALAKSNMDVRPIAIGEVLVRILSRAVCLQLRDQMARVFLASQQFGVGVTCGTEVVVRGVRRALADHPDWVVLQPDVANAFNSFHRDRMFQALQASPEFQCLIPFIGLFYGTPSDLHYRSGTGVVTMHSERGTRQGDPLSPFLYALTQRLALEPVLVEGDVQLWSYADDTYVLGPPDRVLHHFTEIVRRLGEMGLAAQPHKCLVYQTESFLSRDLEAFTGLGIEVARRGLTVTGVPVGTVSFVEQSLPDRLERMGRVLPWLPRLRQPQTAARLLSACVSTRPQYLSRTVPHSPAVISSFTRWNARLGETFQQLLASGTWACCEDVREAALDQIFLPIRLGGFGIRRMARIAPVSFVCSWVQCAPILCSLPACGEVFRQSFASGEPEQIDRALQTALEGLPPDVLSLLPPWPSCASASPDSLFAGASRLLEAQALEAVRARHASPLHLARLTSLQGGGAGAWLTSVPYADPLRIPEALWQAASSSRLGLPIPQLALAGQCSCGQAIDDMMVPHHAVRCPRYGVATTIHDTVKYMLRDFAVEAGFAVKVEDSTLFTQLEAARARLLGQPVVGEGTRAEGPGEQRGEAGQPGGGGHWGQHQLRGQVERGTGGQRGRQGEQTGQDGEGRQHRQQQESQWRPRAQGAAPPGSASEVGQGREQQRADGGTGGAAGLGGEGQGVREAAGDGAGGLGGLGEGREGEGRGQVDGGEERGRETIGEEAPRDQTGQQPAQQQGPVGHTGRVGTASRIPDLTCRDVSQGLMVLVDVSIADPQREGNVQLRRATPTQIGVAAARRVQEKLRHWGPHLEGLQPAPHFYACVAETFGLLSEPLRQFLGLCAKRIAQRRRDRGGGDDGSARIFEAGLTTRLSVALQRAQAQCMIQHAVRQLGRSDDGWMPAPVPLGAGQGTWHHVTGSLLLSFPSLPPTLFFSLPLLLTPSSFLPFLSFPLFLQNIYTSHPLPPHAIRSPRPYPPRARSLAASFDPPCPPSPFPTARHSLLPARALPSFTFSSPLPSSAARLFLPLADPLHSLPLLNPHPAPRISPPYAWFLPSLPLAAFPRSPPPPSPCPPPLSPPLSLASYLPASPFPPPCAQLLPSLPLPPPRPAPHFPPPPRPVSPLPAPPFLSPCLSFAPSLPPPAHAPVFGFSPPCPTFLPSLPPVCPSLVFPSPIASLLPALDFPHPCPRFLSSMPLVSPLCTFSLFPPCPSLPPPLPFALPSLRSLLPIPAALLPPSAHPHDQPPSHPSIPPSLSLSLSLFLTHTHTHAHSPPPPPPPTSSHSAPPCPFPTPSHAPHLPPPCNWFPPYGATLASLAPLLTLCPPLFRALSWPSPCPLLPLPLPPQLPCPPYTPSPIQPPPPSPGCPFPLCTPATVCGFQPPNGGAHGAFLRTGKPPRGPPTPLALPPLSPYPPPRPQAGLSPPSPPRPSPSSLPFPPQLLPHPAWAAPLHPALPGPSRTQLRPPDTTPPFPPPSNLYTPCPCSLRNPATYPSLPLPLPNSTLPFLPPARVYTPCFCSLRCAVPNLRPPFRGTRPPLPPPANLCTPCSCPWCLPTPYPNPPQSPPSPTPSIFPPPWGSPIRSDSGDGTHACQVERSPNSLATSHSQTRLLVKTLNPTSTPKHIEAGGGRARGELAANTAREGVSECVCEGAAEAAEDGAAKAAREGAMGVVGEGAAEVAEERAAEAAREGAAAAARERAAEAAREGAAGTVTLARQRAEAMETGFAGVGATEPAAVLAGGTAAEEAIGTAPGEAAQTTAGVAAGITTGEAAGGTMAGEAAESAVGEAAGSAAGEAVGSAVGEAAESAAGEAAGSAAGEAAGSAAGEAAGSAAGGAAGAAAGEAAADAAGEAARAAACKVGQTLAGEAAQSTAGEVAGTAIGEAAGTAAGEAAGTTADEAAGGTRAGEAAGSAAGEAEIAAAVEVEQILAGEAAQTAAGEAAGTAAGEAAGTAAREAAGTAAGKAAGTAAGEAEQITAGEVLQTAAVEAARTAAGATEATVGAGTGGGATGAAGKGVTGTGARESAASVVAREGTAGARVGEGTAVASKAEGEAAAEAAGRAIARPVGAAGPAANAGKHTAGPAETAKGASSKAAAGGVGSGDIGATGEGEVSVVPTGVGTEEGDVIVIEEDEGEDVMHIDGPLAQYLTPDGEADPAPLQPHVEVPPLPPMPVHMLAEGPMEGLGETLRTEPHEGAPILTSHPPAHPPPGAPFPHPHPQVPVVSRGAAKALAFLAEPCSPTPTLLHGQPPSPSPTPDPTVAGGPPGEHAGATRAESPEGTPSLTSHPSPPLPSLLPSPPRAAHLCPHPQGLLRAPRGAARALAFLEEPCSPTPTNTQPPPTGPLPPPPPGPPPPGSTHISEVEASLRPNPSPTRYRHPNHPSRRTAPTRPPNRLPPSHHPPQAAETHPQGLAPQAHGSGGTRVEGPTGEATTEPTQTSLPPPFVPRSNLHTGPAPRPPPSTPPPGRVPHEWPRWAAITPHTQPARSVPTEGDASRREGMHTEHPPPGEPPILPPTTPLAPQPPLPSQTGADNQVGRRRKNRGRGGRGSAHVLPPPSLPHQEPLPTPHPVEPLPGPTATARPPNPHSRPAPAPPQGHGSGPAHSPPFCPSLAVSPSQVAAAAIATGMEAVGLRDAPMEDATDSPSHPSHPFHVDDPLPQPMVIGEGQGGLLGQGPHPSSAQPASPTPPSTLPALLLSPTGRQVFETPEEVRAGISDLLAIHRPSSSPAAPTLPVPQDRTRTYAEVTRSVPSFIPPATQPGASLPTPMETDQVLRPCHAHLEGVAPPPVQPVAQEVTSSRDEASAPTETPPPGVAEPSLEPHPAEGQEHTTVHTSGSPPRPPSPASTPVPARGPALSCATPPLSSLTPPPHGAGESSPPLIPGDPLGAQAAHGVPSTASSDATAPIDPADTATSPDQVVSCPTCRSSLANRRALQHHFPFCHPADAARRAQAAHDTASIIPSLSQPRATGIQFTDAQWQTLDSVDWTEYFSPERIHARPLRRVPERVRGGYLDVLSAILVRIAQDPEAAGPTFLLAAAPTLFLVPATPPDRSHTAAIATRISRFGRGEWAELVSNALGRRTPLPQRTGHRSRTATDPSTADERRIARCLRLAACNETSRACAALESAEAAPDTQGTIQRLQSKHPNAERPTPAWQSGFQGSPLVLSVDHLRRAIFTAPRGSSGGPSGWVAEHLRDTFLAFPQSLHFLLAVYQQWLRGRCAPAARSLLASSTLVALAKSNMDVRPIAIGEVLVRILSRAVCLQLRDQMARVFLASQQFGVGVTCGTEVVVRGVRRALADHPDWVVLQLDVANAFNSFHRDRMFQALQASLEFQCLIPFIGLFYGTPSDLHYRSGTGVVTMHSERGTRQGDPLSPFLYALTQRLALEPVLVEGDVQLWSYADDTYVLGPPDRVLHHFTEIVRRLGEMDLAAQPHKCLVYQTESFLSRDLEAFTGLGIEVARRGLTVTGVPVGTVSFVEQSLPDRLERMGRVLPWLPRLRQPQTAARLLSACVSTRPQYLSRTVPHSPAVISSFTRWNARLGETFQQLLASGTWACREDVREAALDQIFLPIRLGGFGIRRMARIAPVSFVCSWVQCAPILCSLPACGEVFRQSFASGEPEQIDRALQTALEGLPPDVLSLLPPWPSCASASPDSLFAGASRLLEAQALEAVRARHASPLHLARLTSLQGAGAGAWLTSVPYADPLRIPEALWQAASSSRLGLPIPQLALAGQCSCGQAIDDMTVPHHAVRCPPYGVATTIHDTVKYMLRDFAVEAGFAVKVEDSTLFTQLEAARVRLLGQPVVGEGTRAEGPGEQRGEAGQPGGGGHWGQHQLRGQVERGIGGQRGRQGEQTGQDGEGRQHRQQQESQWRPRAQGAAPPGSASEVGQGREQQRADGGTGGAAGLGGEGQGVKEAAGDGAGGSGGLGEGREGEGRGQVDGGEERGRETIGEEAPRDQTGQQPAQQQGPVGHTGRVGTASRIPDLTCHDVSQGLMVLVDVSIADPQREGNVQLRRATPTQIGVAAARRVQEKLRH